MGSIRGMVFHAYLYLAPTVFELVRGVDVVVVAWSSGGGMLLRFGIGSSLSSSRALLLLDH